MPSKQITLFRKWLEANRVFFEIISSLILATCAIFVSLQANNISKTQAKIMEQEIMPQIEVRKTQVYNEGTRMHENDVVMIFNNGGGLTDFGFDFCSFLFFDKRVEHEKDTLLLSLDGYYDFRGTISGQKDGLIFSIDNRNNNIKHRELSDSLLVLGFIEIQSYARLSYTDLLDEVHHEYYRISPVIQKSSYEEWIKYSELSKNKKIPYSFFPKLKASKIIELL